MASTDAGLSSLSLATYSNNTYYSNFYGTTISGWQTPAASATNIIGTATLSSTSTFTVEAWIYPLARHSGGGAVLGYVFGSMNLSGAQADWSIGPDSTGKLTVFWYNNANFLCNSTNVIPLNTWTHIAVSISTGAIKMFINGIQETLTGTTTATTTSGTPLGYLSSGGYTYGGTTWQGFNGYISNLRVVKSALYSANFVPSTSQLTAIANTSLLTCNTNSFTDGSVNNYTLTLTGSIGLKQFTPLLQTNASVTLSPTFTTGTLNYTFSAPANVQAISVTPTAVDPALATIKYNSNVTLTSGQANIASTTPFNNLGYSTSFTAGMLQYANAPQLNTNGYSWTGEFWVYFTGTYTSAVTFFSKRVSGTNVSAYHAYLKVTTGYLAFYNGTTEYISTTNLQLSTWSHVAYTYDGSQISIYVNGNKIYGAVVAITDNTEPLTIGGIRGYTEWMIGNISNFRFVKGYVIYTGNFTPPTSPLGLTQSSGTNIRAITGAPTNGSSVRLPGSSEINFGSNAGFAFGTGAYTVEFWVYPNIATSTYGSGNGPILVFNDTTGGWGIWDQNANGVGNGLVISTRAGLNVLGSATSLTVGIWNHVVAVRYTTSTNQTSIFLNGVRIANGTDTTNWTVTGPLKIGGISTAGYYINGYVSNLHVVKGYSVYDPTQTTLVVPNSPLVVTTNTQLLALQSSITADASTNNITATTNGTPALSTTISPFNSAGSASTQFLSTSLAYQTVQNAYNPSYSPSITQNNFSIECWVYLTATPPVSPGWYLIQKGVGSTPAIEWSFSITSTTLLFQYASGIPTGTTTSTASATCNITPGVWNHCAITKLGTTITYWFNGRYAGTINNVNNMFYSTSVASYVTVANSQTGATTAFTGFISNARVVYGIAAYTPNNLTGFTPSTNPLSKTQSATSTTALITDSASSYAVANGSGIQFNNTNDFVNFPEPPNLFNSVQFNGSTQSLSVAANTVFVFGTGDFTIEFYFYGPSQTNTFFYDTRGGSASGYPHITTGTSTSVLRWGPTNTQGTIIIGDNKWHHCAVTRQSGTIKLWVDGLSDGSASDTTDYNTSYAVNIGVNSFTGNNLNGYLSNYRIIKGTALYTSNFTPSTIPLTRTSQSATSNQVSLLTCQNYTIIDNSTNAFTITNNGTATVTQNNPFVLYGTGQDVTIEAWVLLSVAPTTRGWIINNSATSTGYFGVAIEAARTVTVWSDSNVTAVLTSATSIPLGTWTHISVVFVNNLIVIYVNGVRDTYTVLKTTVWGISPVTTLFIGRQASAAAQYFPGYITNLRMVYGVAIYTNKYTVPTSPLTNITGTVLLALQSNFTGDSSSLNATGTRGSGSTGLYVMPLVSPFSTLLPTVTNGNSLAFGWNSGVSPTDGLSFSPGYTTALMLPGDFTIDAWIYMATSPATYAGIIDTRTAVSNSYAFGVYNTSGLKLDFNWGAARLTGTTILAINTWYHVAATRKNGILYLWINGVQEATVANTTEFGDRALLAAKIGYLFDPTYWSGYLSNVRLIIGTAIYTSTFTPSTTAYSSIPSITTYPATTNSTGVTYSGSVYFGGATTTSIISTPNAGRFDIWNLDFTIEAWYYSTTTSGGSSYTIASVSDSWYLYLVKSVATTAQHTFNMAGVTGGTLTTSSFTSYLNQWYHVAVVRRGSNVTIYLNGNTIGTTTILPNAIATQSAAGTTFVVGGLNGGTNVFSGYISNVRMIQGYGVYTGPFNPQTSPLSNTQSDTGTISINAISGTSTSLLALQNDTTTDGSTNNFTLTAVGSPTLSSTIVPNIQSLSNSISGLFNGYNYIYTITDATGGFNQLQSGYSSDYTIEAWVYFTGTGPKAGNWYTLCASTNAAGNGLYFLTQITNTGYRFLNRSGSAYYTVSNPIPTANTWTHLAFVNAGVNMSIYLNGVKLPNTVDLPGNGPSAGTIHVIGSNGAYTLSQDRFFGYITNFRAVAGVQVYTGNFTPPTGPLTATQSSGTNISAITAGQTKLLVLQTNLTSDASTNNYTFSNYNNVTSSTQVPFMSANGNSVRFTGSSQYLVAPSNNAFAFGTGDFSIEAWIYLSSGTTGTIYDSRSTTGSIHPVLYIGSSVAVYNVAGVDVITGTTTISTLTWYHVAVCRVNGVTKLYVNGVQNGLSYTDTNNYLIGSPDIGTGINNFNPLNGYMSNLRVVKGVSAYLGPFTPPTTALTSTQSAGTSTNILALNNPVPTYGNSVFFSGNLDYYRVPASTAFMNIGDFTFEVYIYPTSFAAISTIFGQYTTATTVPFWNVTITTAGIITVNYSTTSFTASTAILVNEWYHIAIVRISGTITLYVNGVSYGTASYSGQFGSPALSSPMFIGATQSAGPTQYFAGYMSNLRIVKGIGVYTGAFTVPTSPLNVTQASGSGSVAFTTSQTSLLALQSSTTTENSINNFTLTATGSPTVSTIISPFLTSRSMFSAYFNGTNASLTVPASGTITNLGTGDFTVECWFNASRIPTSSSGDQVFAYGSFGNEDTFRVDVFSGNVRFRYNTAAQSSGGTNIATSAISTSTWYHIAMVRISGTVTCYVNGTSVGSGSLATAYNTAYGFRIGAYNTAGSVTNAPNYWFQGYITNVRIVKGLGVYTGNFTTPTLALNTIQVANTNISALSGSETLLLTCQDSTFTDKSVNALSITNDNSATTSTSSTVPAGIVYYNTVPNKGYGILFTSSSQYITAPSNSVFTFGTGDFTIEGYIYLNSGATSGTLYDGRTGASTVSPQIYIDSNVLYYAVAGTSVITGSTLSTLSWYHIAIVKISGSTKLYVNGTQSGSTYTDSNNYVIGSPYFGTGFSSSYPLNGYISNIRVVKGVGIYTATFSPSTTPLVSSQGAGTNAITGNSTSLLAFQNGPFNDNSNFNQLLTPFGNPHYSPLISPTQYVAPAPSAGNSAYFNQSSYMTLTMPSNAGTGDFCVELWVYMISAASDSYLLSTAGGTTGDFHLWYQAGSACWVYSIDTTYNTNPNASTNTVKTNTWYHLALMRVGTIIYFYVNGIRQSSTLSKATQFGNTGTLNIGRSSAATGYFKGYITNLRFVYGSSVYIPGVTYPLTWFSIPYTPLTAITNTSILLFQTTLTKDNSTNNVTVTNNGVILSTTFSPYTITKFPVMLTAQSSNNVTTTGIRDNSMYNATMTVGSLNYSSYQPSVSPFGVTPALLVGQSSLIRDNSISNYTLNIISTPNLMPYVTPFNNDAIQFNGSTQYITGSNVYNSLGGDFTIEFFMLSAPQTAAVGALLLGRNTAWNVAANNNWYIMCSSPAGVGGNALQTIQLYNFGTLTNGAVFVGNTPVCDSKWHHVAIVRINNIVTVYIDGVVETAAQTSKPNTFTSTGVWDYSNYTIGSNANDGGSTVAQLAYNGMLSNLRIINGVGIYTGAFTPPTSNLARTQNSSTNIVQYTPTSMPINGYSLSSTQSGAGIIVTNIYGLGLYLNDYTIEFYHYMPNRTSAAVTCLFSSAGNTVAGSIEMFAGHSTIDTNKYVISFNNQTANAQNWLVSNSSLIFGKWVHTAIVRRSGITYLYLNGILDNSSGVGNFNIVSPTSSGYRWFIGTQSGSVSPNNQMNALISNFRVVNGIGVYSGLTFTVPTNPLTITQNSSTNIAAISNSLVTNGGALGLSNVLNTGQIISSQAVFPPGRYDFTVEGYIFLNTFPTVDTWAAGCMVLFASNSANTTTGIFCVIGQTQLYVVLNNTKYGYFTHNLSLYTWNHIAYVRVSDIVYFYVNGTRIGSIYVPISGTATNTYIGSHAQNSSYSINGYLSNLRVTRFQGIYTNNFPSSTTNILGLTQSSVTTINSVSSSNVSLLAFQTNITTDASTNNFTLSTSGAVSTSTTVVPAFTSTNGYSWLFNSSSTDYITISGNNIFNLGTQDFTVDAWVYLNTMPTVDTWPTNYTNTMVIVGVGTPSGADGFNCIIGATKLMVQNSDTGYTSTSNHGIVINTWYHVAYVKINGVLTYYVNGVSLGTSTVPSLGTGSNTYIGSETGQGAYFNGYISNLRVTKYKGLYTSNFTPSTTALTTTQNTNSLGTVSNPIILNGYSNYFNGTSTYLSILPDQAYTFGTGNFTIECWFYTYTPATAQAIFDLRSPTDTANIGFDLYLTSSVVRFGTAGSNYIVGTTTIVAYRWYHVAVVRTGITSMSMYLNGVQEGSTYTASATQNFTNNTPRIGYGADGYFNGYISNLRVMKGVALYTGPFVIPSQPLTTTQTAGTVTTAITGTSTSLLALTYDSITDRSTNNFTLSTTGTVSLSTSIIPSLSRINGSSVLFNGSTDYLTWVPSATTAFGTGDFTVEVWVYALSNTASTAMLIVDTRNAGQTTNWVIGIGMSSANGRFGWYTGTAAIEEPTTVASINTWYHIAYSRSGTTGRFFVNGTLVATGTDSTNYNVSPTISYIGSRYNQTNYFYGYLSNLRIVKGAAVYTGTFARPNNPLTSTQSANSGIAAITGTNTSLLALQSSNTTTDNSSNNLTLTNVGTLATSTSVTPFIGNWNSVFFNGGSSGDKLTISASSAFDFSGGTFTIEFFMYPTVMPSAGNQCRILMFGTNGTSNSYNVSFNNDGSIGAIVPLGSPVGVYSSAGVITANAWYHVAVSCNAGVANLYINGVLRAGPASILLPTAGNIGLNIGYDTVGTVNFQYQGYLTNLRIVKGVSVYTGNFTVPTSPLSTTQSSGTNINAITSLNVSLLMLQSGVTNDSSPNNFVATTTGAPTLNNTNATYMYFTPANISSVFFNGSSNYITAPSNSVFTFGTGDFTIESWLYILSGTTATIFDSRSTANSVHPVLYVTGNQVRYRVAGIDVMYGPILSNLTWYHIALVRISGVTNLYVGGLQSSLSYTDTNNYLIGSPYIGTGINGFSPLTGYMSNLRVVKGVGVYGGNFIVPTTVLTSTQTSVASNTIAITGTQTSLLMLQSNRNVDASSNAFTATVVGNPTMNGAIVPFNSYLRSSFFNGSGNYVSATSNSAFTFGTSNFTIEAFIYLSGSSTGTIFDNRTGSTTVHPVLYISSGIVRYAVAGVDLITGIPLDNFVWYHIAVVRASNNTTLYINGKQYGSTVTDNNDYQLGAPLIGQGYNNTNPLTGYISNLRVVNGVAVYTSNFFVPVMTLTSTQIAGTLPNNIVAVTGTPPATGNSVLFTPSTFSQLSVASNAVFAMGTGNFTVEGWIYVNAFTTNISQNIFDLRSPTDTANAGFGIALSGAGKLVFETLGTIYITSTATLVANNWYHIAISRNSTTQIQLYINGALDTTYTASVTQNFTNSTPRIGNGPAGQFNGYITNLRVVKGQGLYTAAFTMPTTVLTTTSQGAIASNVSLLTCQSSTIIDNSTYALTISTQGNPTVSALSYFNPRTSLLTCQSSTVIDNSINGFGINNFTGQYNNVTVVQDTPFNSGYVSLLTCQNNTFIENTGFLTSFPSQTWTHNGTPSINSNIIPFRFTSGVTSVFFNGATQYVVAPSDTAFTFGTGDFTVESWIYLLSGTTGTIFDSRTTANSVHPVLYVSGTVRLRVAGVDVIVGQTIATLTWYHVAVSRVSGVTKLFVNGLQTGSNYTDTNTYLIGSPDFGTGLNGFSPLTGYLSNLRVIKGVAAYTGNFPVPVSPLTTSQSSLTPVSAIINPGTVSNSSSIFFNGSSDITFNHPSEYKLSNQDFTIECYVLTTQVAGTRAILNLNIGSGYNLLLRYNATNWELFRIAAQATTFAYNVGTDAQGGWVHHAMVRINGVFYWYINGIMVYTIANTSTYVDTSITIGNYAGTYWSGFISNLRIVRGVGVYTGSFTPPTSPLTLTQNAGTNIAAIPGLITNGYSVSFTRASVSQLSLASNAAFAMGTGNFTVECWFFTLNNSVNQDLFDLRSPTDTANAGFSLFVAATSLRVTTNGTTYITGATSLATNTWYHAAVVRESTTVIKMYLNGVQEGSTYTASATQNFTNNTPRIGNGVNGALDGYITNLRVVKGQALYTANFVPSTTPLTTTSQGAVAANVSLLACQNTTLLDNSTNNFTITSTLTTISTYSLFQKYTALLALQNGATTDGSINNNYGVTTGTPTLETSVSPFTSGSVQLLTAQSALNADNAVGYTISSTSNTVFQRVTTPFGAQTPVALLTCQYSNIFIDSSYTNLSSNIGSTAGGPYTLTNTVNGPFNTEPTLLTFQDSIVADNTLNKGNITVVGGGVSPTDQNPFTSPKGFTSLLIPYGYTDTSYNNSNIANNANIAQTNFIYNPAIIPSSLVSVLALQTSNTLLESSINNSTLTALNTAPVSNTLSPFGTYYSNGLIILNTNSTTGIYGTNIVNYANILVTAGDTVTTNAYSITVTSLNNVGNIGNRTTSDSGLIPAQTNANIILSDLGNSNINEATILTFANTTITPNLIDYGITVAPSNTTFIITDVANSNLGETLNSIFVSNVSIPKIYVDSGLGQVSPSNTTFFISDVANSNIGETLANTYIGNVSTIRSIQDSGTQPPPSPVGGTVLFPTYAYTDGVTITAANVQSGGSSGSFASNQQVWYQT